MSDSLTLDQIKKPKFDPGDYSLSILDAKEVSGISPKNGQPWEKVELTIEILDGPRKGARQRHSFWYSDVEDLLNACDIKVSDVATDGKIVKEDLFFALKGKKFNARVGVDDKGYARIAKFLPKAAASLGAI